MERSPKELFFEAEQLKAAGKKKKETVPVRSLPHTEESREEEKRVNPSGRSGGKGYATPFLNVEDIADTQMNPEEELMAKEDVGIGKDVAEEKDGAEKLSSEHLKPEDYPDYYANREEWEQHLRSLPDQNYAARLRAKFARKELEETRQDSETTIHKEHEIERQVLDSLLQQPKQEKISPVAFGLEERIKLDKQRGREKRKSQKELPKSVKARRRFRKLKTALEKHS